MMLAKQAGAHQSQPQTLRAAAASRHVAAFKLKGTVRGGERAPYDRLFTLSRAGQRSGLVALYLR